MNLVSRLVRDRVVTVCESGLLLLIHPMNCRLLPIPTNYYDTLYRVDGSSEALDSTQSATSPASSTEATWEDSMNATRTVDHSPARGIDTADREPFSAGGNEAVGFFSLRLEASVIERLPFRHSYKQISKM
jgi:hypothetical protein